MTSTDFESSIDYKISFSFKHFSFFLSLSEIKVQKYTFFYRKYFITSSFFMLIEQFPFQISFAFNIHRFVAISYSSIFFCYLCICAACTFIVALYSFFFCLNIKWETIGREFEIGTVIEHLMCVWGDNFMFFLFLFFVQIITIIKIIDLKISISHSLSLCTRNELRYI